MQCRTKCLRIVRAVELCFKKPLRFYTWHKQELQCAAALPKPKCPSVAVLSKQHTGTPTPTLTENLIGSARITKVVLDRVRSDNCGVIHE